MSPRTGRPKSDNPKAEQIKIRATKQDKALLDKCCEMTGKTQYEVIMEGIHMVYAENKKSQLRPDQSLQLLKKQSNRKGSDKIIISFPLQKFKQRR